MSESIVIGLINCLSGVFFVAFSIPLIKRKIPLNDWYGFRFSRAFESDENWYAINEYGARKMIKWALVLVGAGLTAFFLNFENRPFLASFWATVPIIFSTLIPIIQSLNYSKKISAGK